MKANLDALYTILGSMDFSGWMGGSGGGGNDTARQRWPSKTRAKNRRLNKIAYKSRRINRLRRQ